MHLFFSYDYACVYPYLYQPIQNMGGPLLPQPVQQGVASQGAAPKASLPSTWSDHAVNISLDFLGPGMQPPKPSQPSLNSLQQGEIRQQLT